MTVPSTDYQTSFTGDGETTVFDFDWAATETSQVQTYINGTLQESGVTVALSLVAEGGTVTFAVAPVSGAVGLLSRNTDYLQNDTLVDNAPLPVTTVNSMFDKLTIMVQQIANLISSALQFPLTAGIPGVLPTPVGGSVVAVNAAASGAAYVEPVAAGYVLTDSGPGGLPYFGPAPSVAGGNVTGPASAATGAVPLFSGTSGKVLGAGASPVASGYVLTDNGVGQNPSFQAGPGTKFTLNTKSSAFNVNGGGEMYLITGTCTGTLPASPADGTIRKFLCTAAGAVLTLTPNGGDTILIGNQAASTLNLYFGNGSLELMAITGGWAVT